MTSVESSFVTATEMFKEVFEQVAKEKQELDNEKQKWEEEKSSMGGGGGGQKICF